MPEAPLIIRGGRAFPPREVEQVLLDHPAVAEAAVVGVPSRLLNEIVGAAVRLSAPLPSAAAELTAYCRARLGWYQVPARWLFTDALPRTTAGEPRRAAIIALLMAAPGPDGASSAAQSAGVLHGTAAARMTAVSPLDLFRPRAATEDLRIPEQLRRSWALDDLDHL
jgi:hypothetical protein